GHRGRACGGGPGPARARLRFFWFAGAEGQPRDLRLVRGRGSHCCRGGPRSCRRSRGRASMKSAALITHSHPPAATEAVAVAVEVAREAGWRLRATEEEAAKHGAVAEGIETVAGGESPPDVCLVFGGDGSILHALRRYARTGVPVFGVNFGTVGFLAAVERDEAAAGIRRALAGETETIDLPALAVEIAEEERFALNDVSFSRRPRDRVAELPYRLA